MGLLLVENMGYLCRNRPTADIQILAEYETIGAEI